MKIPVRLAMSFLLSLALVLPTMAWQSAPRSNFQGQTRQKREGREHHPHIRAAIRELQEAKRELQSAAHDFGGHREDALKSCDEAIRQLQQALQYDKQ